MVSISPAKKKKWQKAKRKLFASTYRFRESRDHAVNNGDIQVSGNDASSNSDGILNE